jgi:phosphate transport system substrate-binding protein
MKGIWHAARLLFLVALVLTPALLSAQQDDAVTVVGSGVVAPLLQAFADASETDIPLELNIAGTNSGFETFCAGEAAITVSTRPISVDEEAACAANEVFYLELLAGVNAAAFVAHPGVEAAQCFTSLDLDLILPPSATGQITNWTQISPAYTDLPLSVFIPREDTPNFALVDALVEGVGLRTDAAQLADDAAIIDSVSQTPGALGLVSLPAAEAAGDAVKILLLDVGDAPRCEPPSARGVETRAYGLGERLFVYVNEGSLDQTRPLLDFISSDEAAAVVAEAGFTAPSEIAYTTNRDILANVTEGRQFSREVTAFEIPPQIIGQLNIGGAATAYSFIQAVTDNFVAIYPSVTLNRNIEGTPAGFRRLCNGEFDLALANRPPTEEEQGNCDANNIATVSFDLGRQAVVLVANDAADYLTCLTTDQLATIWRSSSSGTVESWDQVDESFPAGEMFLFAPTYGSPYADLLLITTTGGADPGRTDIELSDDPLYRAAATGNVETALAYMSYPDYLAVLENEQQNIQLVAVDGGDGCIEPSAEAIADGTYPLTQPLLIIANQVALNRIEVQSLLWTIFSDENYFLLEDAGLIGIDFAALPDLRDNLQDAFTAAAEAAVNAAEATAEPTAEATAEGTEAAEPTAEATAE